jgi:RNA polymerase sigma-70 factor (ECF subfamily)
VLIMREVLGFSARSRPTRSTRPSRRSTARSSGHGRRSTTSCPSAASSDAAALGDDEVRALVERYVDAWERNDVAAVVAMLTADATFAMPPNLAWFRGREAIAAFLPTGPMSRPAASARSRANGQLAFGTYIWEPELGRFRPNAIHLIDLDGDGSARMTAFLDPAVFPRFGLPDHLPAGR